MTMSIGSSGASAMMTGMLQNRPGPDSSKMAEELLSAADTDSNGSISKAEFSTLMQSNDAAQAESIEGIFSQIDSSADGELAVDEISDALSKLHEQMHQMNMPPPPPPPHQSAEELISTGDMDSDNALDFEEFSAALSSSNGSSEEGSTILEEMFANADADGDGQVTGDELQSAMDSHRPDGPPPPPPQSAEELISAGDIDSDSALNFDEFSAVLQTPNSGDESTILESMFDEADADGDGKVTEDELQAAIESHNGTQAENTIAGSTNTEQVSRMIDTLLQAYQGQDNTETTTAMSALA